MSIGSGLYIQPMLLLCGALVSDGHNYGIHQSSQ